MLLELGLWEHIRLIMVRKHQFLFQIMKNNKNRLIL